jgi:cellulose synthase (UDP-forming)
VPRLIFLTAPLIYLLLERVPTFPDTGRRFWPMRCRTWYAFERDQLADSGRHRHSFWNEIYETVLSPYILLPTMMALINPRLGKFNVTAKGGVVKQTFFDTRIAQPFLVMLLFNIAGLLVAIPRFFIWDRDRPGTVMMNVIWCMLQRHHSGGMHRGSARVEAVADHGAHQRGNPRCGQNAGRKVSDWRDNQHVQRRHQHPFQ